MGIKFQRQRVPIPNGTKRREIPVQVPMGGPVKQNGAEVAIKGFRLQFTNGDRNIQVAQVETTGAVVSGDEVQFSLLCQYADRLNDDEYSGSVDVLVIADMV